MSSDSSNKRSVLGLLIGSAIGTIVILALCSAVVQDGFGLHLSTLATHILGWGLGVPLFVVVFINAMRVPLDEIKCPECGTRFKRKRDSAMRYNKCRKCGFEAQAGILHE